MAASPPAPRLDRSPFLFAALGAALVVCWSSGFVGIRYTNETVPLAQVLFWRSFMSGLLLVPLMLWRGPPLTARVFQQQAVFAFLGMFLYLGGFALAIAWRVPTGLVALMADLAPLGIAALSFPVLGQPLTGRQWLGTAIALAGVLAVSADSLRLGEAPVLAYVLPILGMGGFALATVLQRRRGVAQVTVIQSLCLQCLFAALMFAPFAALTDGLVPPLTSAFALGMAWLVLLATFGAWILYYIALRLFSPVRVSAVIYLSPPVTLLWAWALFGEPVGPVMFAGLAVTLAGVALVARGPAAPEAGVADAAGPPCGVPPGRVADDRGEHAVS